MLVLEAKAKLVYNPPVRSLLVFGYQRHLCGCATTSSEPAKFGPVGLEGARRHFYRVHEEEGPASAGHELHAGRKAWLLIEFGGNDKEEADANARKCMDELKQARNAPPMKLFDDPAQEKLVWHLREEGLGATAKVPGMPENHEGWEDASVPPDRLGRTCGISRS